MQKTKLMIKGLWLMVNIMIALVLSVKPISASVLSIQQLPSYITTNNFKLSCTTDATSAQFSYSKNGGAFTDFGPLIDTTINPCVVQVDSSVVNDQTTYTFKVNGGPETTTFYDVSGPSGVSGYYKEHINDGENKLHWTNPSDSDFAQVVIYHGDSLGFSADAGHEIARVSGGAGANMSYDDNYSPDPNKTYYYYLRALDKAGNSSSLVGDSGTIQATASPAAGAVLSANVTQMPKEGQVLSDKTSSPSANPTPSEAPIGQGGEGLLSGLTNNRLLVVVIALVLVVAGFFLSKRKNNPL